MNRLTVAGLVVVAIGIWTQSLSGVPDYPSKFPPGPIILVVLALVIALAYRRFGWMPILGTLMSLLITVGAFVRPGTGNRLSDPGVTAAFIGTVIQMLALLTTIPAGILATIRNYRGQ
jgi:hypothetical protein